MSFLLKLLFSRLFSPLALLWIDDFLASLAIIFSTNREFDENILRRISDIFYEDEVVNLPCAPDVSNYLISEVYQNNFCTSMCHPGQLITSV